MIRNALAFASRRWGPHFMIAVFLTLLKITAGADVSGSDVPSFRWSAQADMITYAIVFTTVHPSSGVRKVIRVFVKNLSDMPKGLPWSSSDQGTGIIVYYLDDSSTKHRIHDYYHAKPDFPGETIQEKAVERAKEMASLSGSASMRQIAPRQTLSVDVELSPSDLMLIGSHPVQCCFNILDLNTSQGFGVSSKPAKLSELSVGTADK